VLGPRLVRIAAALFLFAVLFAILVLALISRIISGVMTSPLVVATLLAALLAVLVFLLFIHLLLIVLGIGFGSRHCFPFRLFDARARRMRSAVGRANSYPTVMNAATVGL
jgi:hypothetical protein